MGQPCRAAQAGDAAERPDQGGNGRAQLPFRVAVWGHHSSPASPSICGGWISA